MSAHEFLIALAFLFALTSWGVLTSLLLGGRALYDLRHQPVRNARRRLEALAGGDFPRDQRARHVESLLERLPRRTVDPIAADATAPAWLAEAFAHFALTRWGVERLVREARRHRGERTRWRRIAALRILALAQYPKQFELLEAALDDDDVAVQGAAVSLLGRHAEPWALELLVSALSRGRYSRSRIATAIERSPQDAASMLRPLLEHPEGAVRFWAATLLRRYPGRGFETPLAVAAEDPDPNVRKAAVESLGHLGGVLAAETAVRLLEDPAFYVRSHAARAIAELGRVDLADRLTPLLSHPEWWVRLAVKESLEALGPDVWPVVARHLEDEDRFARNGAAEVLQNLGLLQRLAALAGRERLDAEGAALLRKALDAGGRRMLEGVFEQAVPGRPALVQQLIEAATRRTAQ